MRQYWRAFRAYSAALNVDNDVVRLDANLAQHRTDQCRFVLAVTVTVDKNIRRRMRLHTSYAQAGLRRSERRVA